jgi:hypothetical protein
MKQLIIKTCLLFLPLVFFFALTAGAQDISGIWKGYFRSQSGEQYKLEFQIVNNKTFATTGVSYSYLDIRFYGKATMTGTYSKNSKKLRIKEIRTVEVKSSMGGTTCIMNYDLQYTRSGKEEFLEGTYLGRDEHPMTFDTSYWGDCGYGTVVLRRVAESDFYVEPFLRTPSREVRPPVNNNRSPVITKPKTNTSTNKPKTKVEKPLTKPMVKMDTMEKITTPPVTKKDPPVKLNTPSVIRNRTNELVKTFVVHNENIVVKLYDNGEIDDDTISVYMDKKLVLSSKRLTASPLIINIKMDEDNNEHELVMVAENLGRIPPNTSLMIVESGNQRFDVRITSTEQKNAVVRFRYEKPN